MNAMRTSTLCLFCLIAPLWSQGAGHPWLAHPAATVQQRVGDIPVPAGYERISTADTSFAAWLRALPLKAANEPVRLHDGRLKSNQTAHYRILDIDTGPGDLQQCADAVMRLYAEYQYSRHLPQAIAFHFTSGDRASYTDWVAGKRPQINGNRVSWQTRASVDSSYSGFRRYLQNVFRYAGTWSLQQELEPVQPLTDLRPGDVFIQGGFPGHAVLVMDLARESRNGKIIFLLAQSYMPAQDIHILINPQSPQRQPWYTLEETEHLQTPEWSFQWNDLKRFPPPESTDNR